MTRFQTFALALASVLVTASTGRAGAAQVKADEQTARVEPVLVACAGDRGPSADGGNSDPEVPARGSSSEYPYRRRDRQPRDQQ